MEPEAEPGRKGLGRRAFCNFSAGLSVACEKAEDGRMTTLTRRELGFGLGISGLALAPALAAPASGDFPFKLSDAEWRNRLTRTQYAILRRAGTEVPGTSPLDREKRAGLFECAGCAQPLFSSTTKFDSNTGWPSFYAPLPGAVGEAVDRSAGMTRTEVHCRRCGGHLGHVFKDGPPTTGLRYCMNGVAMTFRPGAA